MNFKMPKSFVAFVAIIGLFVCMFIGVNATGDSSLTEFFSNTDDYTTTTSYSTMTNITTTPESITYEPTTNTVIYGKTGVLSYSISNGVVTITDCDTDAKGQIEIPSTIEGFSVQIIKSSTFKSCIGITNIFIPEFVSNIENDAFSDCILLESIEVDNNNPFYSNDEKGILYNDNKTELIRYPAGRTDEEFYVDNNTIIIDSFAFTNCDNLISIFIPENVEKIYGNLLFDECDNLKEIIVDSNNQYFSSDEYGVLFNKDKTELIEFPFGSKIKEYTIPNSVITVAQAFDGVMGIEKISIPNSVESGLDNFPFQGCKNLTSIVVSEENTKYSSDDNGVLFDKNKTVLIKYPEGKTDEKYIIPEGVTVVNYAAIEDNDFLVDVTIAETVNTLVFNAFRGCDRIESIHIPASLTEICVDAFESCKSLESITVDSANPDYSSVDGVLFDKNCHTLIIYPCGKSQTSYTVPNGVYTIQQMSFLNCENITNVVVSENVTTIGFQAFWECSNLSSISFYKNLSTIKYSAFADCPNLKNINYYGTQNQWNTIKIETGNEVLYSATINFLGEEETDESTSKADETSTEIITTQPSTELTTEPTTSYENELVYGVLSYIVQNGEVTITNCDETASGEIVIPEEIDGYPVTTIGDNAFSNCRKLTSILFPDNLTTIGACVFHNCTISRIDIPKNVAEISEISFFYNSGLAGIYVDSENKVYSSDENGVLFNKDKTILIKYPNYNKSDYIVPDSVVTIENSAFNMCFNLEKITLPSSVKSIGTYAFASCTKLTNIIIPEGVTEIKENTFKDCVNLNEITIPDSVTSIGDYAFYECGNLTDIALPKALKKIGAYAFCYCCSLTDVTLHEGLETIGGCAFDCCETLTSITIPDSVTDMGISVFARCINLKSVIMPKGIDNIYYYMFEGCSNLSSVTIHSSVKTIYEDAFYGCENFTDVYFYGSQEEWNDINFFDGNEPLHNATIHFSHEKTDFETGDIIEFGSYPQSEVTDNNLIAELNSLTLNWISYKYYQNMDPSTVSSTSPQDIMEYADVEYNGEKYRAVKIAEYRTGSTYRASFDGFQQENGYSVEKVYWFKYEPLQWQILDPDKGLVVCVSIIDSQPFNNLQEEKGGEYYGDKNYSNYSNDYTTSSIREWLNEDFYNIAFSNAEKAKLVATTLDNSGYDSVNNKYNYSESIDSVFLLSFDDMCNEAYGFSLDRVTEDEDRIAIGTDYAKCQGLNVNGNSSIDEDEQYFGNSYYWLRTAGHESSYWSCIATYAGTVSWAGDVSSTYAGIRPAVTIDLSGFEKIENVVTISGVSANIAIGETTELAAKVVSGNIDINEITWSSSNSDVATVYDNGSSAKITAVSKGKTTIIATTADGVSATFTLSVYQPVTSIELNKTNLTIPIGSSAQLIATVLPVDADNPKILRWDTDNYNVAYVVDGLVTAKEVGTATITAITDDGRFTASCVVTVVQPVTGVKLNSTSLNIIKGKTSLLTVEVSPWDATDKSVTWSSSNNSVAIVDANGKITAKSTGTATITVKSNDGGYTDVCTVKVINQPVTGITLNKTSVSVVKGKTYQLSATISPSDAYNKNVTWSSSNSSVATVNSLGKVTAKSVGTATITVKTQDGGYTAKCTVTVKADTISVTGVSLNKTKTTIFVGKTDKLSATVKPSDATNKNVTWKSSDTSIATVDSNGKITAVKKGTATITVTTKDGSKTAKCTVTVKPYNENISKTGTFVVGSEKYSQSVTFDANWLNTDSYDYNHNMAKFCSYVSLLTYSSQKEIRTGIESLGFKTFADEKTLTRDVRKNVVANKDTVIYWPDKNDTVYGKNCFVITKKNYVMSGENHTVVLVMLRGTYGNEWYSNFDPWGRLAGNTTYNGTHHYYFYEAAMFVKGYLDTYMESNSLYNNDNVEIIITGHSRGAAVANLLAAEIVGNTDLSDYPVEENIFTYTFATPNVSNNTSRTNDVYNNIFNFVNPEDFVTKCVPSKWGYGRYGITLTLPSKTNESKSSYKTYYNNMNPKFNNYKGRDYQPYTDGEDAVYNVVNKMTSTVPSIKDFYNKKMKNTYATTMTPYEFFRDTLCTIVSETADKDSMVSAALYCYSAALDPVACKTYKQIMRFFVGNEALGILSEIVNEAINSTYFYEKWDVFVDYTFANKYFSDAHCAETYTAFVTSMNYDQAYTWAKGTYRKGYKGTVNCPVDVEVYDKDTGELVGRIVNNVIDEEVAAGENSIVMTVIGDSKSYWLPSSGNYEVKLIGNNEGIMNHTVSEIDGDIGEIRRINFVDVPVSKDFEMCSEYNADDFKIEDIVLVTELGEAIEKTEILEDESLQTLSVKVSVEGVGIANGYDSVTKGDYIILEATTDENNSFLGWYEDENLVSEESVYGFVVDQNVSLVARFTDVVVNVEKAYFDEAEILLELTGENTSKLLNININPENATKTEITWESSNTEIVKVNELGVVEAVSEGKATITATTTTSDGTKILSKCEVTVKAREFIVEWIIDGVSNKYLVKESSEIIRPAEPSKTGYKFVGWTPEVPSTMPAYNLTFTAVFEKKPELETADIINLPTQTTIKYGDVIILHVDASKIPEGGRVEWSADNGNFNYSANGETCRIDPNKSGSTTFTATIYDAQGNAVSKDEQTMTSKAGFFDKIIAFFKKLFGLTKVIPQAFKGVL